MLNKVGNVPESGNSDSLEMANPTQKGFNMPAVLNFLESEWSTYENEKAKWEIERADYKTKLAFLRGERDGHINFKNDLIRRIKMLELAIRQERIQYNNKIKDLEAQSPDKSESNLNMSDELKVNDLFKVQNTYTCIGKDEPTNKNCEDSKKKISQDNMWKINSGVDLSDADDFDIINKGRQILKSYLNETGYIDNVIKKRKEKIKKLYPHYDFVNNKIKETDQSLQSNYEDNSTSLIEAEFNAITSNGTGDEDENIVPPAAISLKNVEQFSTDVEQEFENDAINSLDFINPMDDDENNQQNLISNSVDDEIDIESIENINLFSPDSSNNASDCATKNDFNYYSTDVKYEDSPSNTWKQKDLITTVKNYFDKHKEDSDYALYVKALKTAMLNSINVTFRGHLDVVRCIDCHSDQKYIVSGSDDSCIKLWDISKYKAVVTFRGHIGPVVFVKFLTGIYKNYFISCGYDKTIRIWNTEQYINGDEGPHFYQLENVKIECHEDIVWEVVFSECTENKLQLCSLDSQGIVFFTNFVSNIKEEDYTCEKCMAELSKDAKITSINYFTPYDILFGFEDASIVLWNQESKLVKNFDTCDFNSPVIRLYSDIETGFVIGALDDSTILIYSNFEDITTLSSKLNSHKFAISSLAVNANLRLFITACNDGFIRVWDIKHAECIKEVFCAIQKADEGTMDVCIQGNNLIVCTAGSDSHINVYKHDYEHLMNTI